MSLEVGEKEIAAVLGANGAGKTTTLRAISNTVRRSGAIRFAGKSLTRRTPEAIVRLGVAHVPEGRGTFAELTVDELVVEQNANIALDAATTAYVLEAGRVALSGPSAELRENDSVRRSYLGY